MGIGRDGILYLDLSHKTLLSNASHWFWLASYWKDINLKEAGQKTEFNLSCLLIHTNRRCQVQEMSFVWSPGVFLLLLYVFTDDSEKLQYIISKSEQVAQTLTERQ